MAKTRTKLFSVFTFALVLVFGFSCCLMSAFAADSGTTVTDPVKRGGLTIYKADLETQNSEPQGDASLAGVTYTIRNDSDHAIVYRYGGTGDSDYYSITVMPGDYESIHVPVKYYAAGTRLTNGDVVGSGGAYVAQTRPDALPYGTYRVWESSAGSNGYNLIETKTVEVAGDGLHSMTVNYDDPHYNYIEDAQAEQFSDHDSAYANLDSKGQPGYSFTVSETGQQVTFKGNQSTPVKESDVSGANYTAGPSSLNWVTRYGFKVEKYDADFGNSTPQGAADLMGAVFNIYNSSAHSVIVRKADGTVNTDYGTNGVVAPGGLVASISVGDNYFAETVGNLALPYGTYIAAEVKAPTGYLLGDGNDNWAAANSNRLDYNPTQAENPFTKGHFATWQKLVASGFSPAGAETLSPRDIQNGLYLFGHANPVKRGGVEIHKADYDFAAIASGDTTAQGDASLNGASIAIYNDGPNSIYMKDTKETIAPGGLVRTITTGDVTREVEGQTTVISGVACLYGLPYGKYHAVEVDPSTGYNVTDSDVDEWYYEFEIGDSALGTCTADGESIVTSSDLASNTSVAGEINRSYNTATHALTTESANLYEHVIRHGELDDQLSGDYGLNKVDAESALAESQGAASMVGTQVTFKNVSENAITYKDVTTASAISYKDRAFDKRIAVGADVVTVTLVPIDADGNIVYASDGVTPNRANPKAAEKKPLVGLDVTDDERLAANIKWYVWRVAVPMEDGSISYEKLTGLPYGTYELRETAAGKGYTKNTTWTQTIVLHNDQEGAFDTKPLTRDAQWLETIYKTGIEGGKIPGVAGLTNQVERIDVGFTKTGPDGRPLAGVPFRITSKSTGEWHIVVTDKNGRIDTRAWQANDAYDATDPWVFMHNRFTNYSDAAYDPAAGFVDSSKLYWQHGHWWFGYADTTYGDFFQTYGYTDPSALCAAINNGGYVYPTDETGFGYELNARSALPYDVYEIQELRSDANAGMNLIEPFDFYAIEACHGSNDGFVELATLDNTGYDPTSEKHIVPVSGDDRVFVEKTANPAANSQVNGSSDITYTLSYENAYVGDVTDTVVRDYIPASTTFKSATGDYKYVEATDTTDAYVEWSLGTLARNATGQVTMTVTVDRNPAQPIIANQAHYQSLDYDVNPGEFTGEPWGATNVVRHSVDGTKTAASLKAVKTAEPAQGAGVDRGGIINYTVTITNDGATAADNVGVFDFIPVGTTLATTNNASGYQVPVISEGGRNVNGGIGWQLGTMAPGATKTVSFAVKVNDDAYGVISNAATFGTATGIPMTALGNVSNTVYNGVGLGTDLSMTKTADKTDVSAGSVITYTIDLENVGAANIENLTVTDRLPEHTSYVDGSATEGASFDGETVTWSVPSLMHDGGKISLSFAVVVDADVKDGVVIENTANATDGTHTWSATSGAAQGYDAVKDMSVSKSADPADGSYVTRGQQIVYTIDWTNNGGNPVYGFAVRDKLPEGVHLVDGSIVITSDSESSADAPTAVHDDTIIRTGNSVDAGTFEEGEATIAGQYSVTVPDPDAAYKFIMARDWASEDLTISADKSIPAWDDVRAYLYDSARVVGDWVEFESTNAHSYNYLWRATVLDSGQIKLCMCVLTPADTNQARIDGARANYDVAGDAVVALVDCVNPGESGSLSFIVEVDDTAADNLDIINGATYGAGITNFGTIISDLPAKTNQTTHIVGQARFGVDPNSAVKTVSQTSAKRGDIIDYTIAVTNTGTAYAKDVAIVDSLLDNGVQHVRYVMGSFKVEGGDSKIVSAPYAQALTRDSNTVEAHASRIAPGETMTMTFSVELTDVVDGDVVHNFATYGDGGNFVLKTNTTEVAIQTPQLRVVKSSDPESGTTVLAGDTIAYTITVANDSDVAASGVAVYDRLPSHTTFVSADEPLMYTDGALVADNISLASKEEKSFTFKVKVDASAENDTIVSNRATAGFASAPAWPLEIDSNEVVHNVVSFEQKNDLNLPAASGGLYAEKFAGVVNYDVDEHGIVEFGKTDINAGDTAVYRIQYGNTGVDVVNAGIIRDYLPEDVVLSHNTVAGFTSPISEGGVYVSADKSANGRAYVEWTHGAMQPGETADAYMIVDVATDPHALIANQARYEATETQLTAGDASNAEPVGRTNVVYLKTDASAVSPAAVSVVKSADPATGTTVSAGDTITYTLTATNNGDTAASGIGIYDVIPAGCELASSENASGYATPSILGGGTRIGEDGIGWIVSQLASGESVSVSFSVKVVDANAFSVSNKASFGLNVGDVAGPMPGITNLVAHAVEHVSDLSITKTSDPAGSEEAPGKVSAGDIVNYTLTVTNAGNGNSDAVEVFDKVPAGMQLVSESMWGGSTRVEPTTDDPFMHWTLDSIKHDGGTAEVGFSARVVDSAAVGQLIENEASLGYRWVDASYEGWSYDLSPRQGHGYVFGDRASADAASANESIEMIAGTYKVHSDEFIRTVIMLDVYDGAFNLTGKRIYTIEPGQTMDVRIPASGEMYISSVETHDTAAGAVERSVYDKPVVHFEMPAFTDVATMALSNKTVHEVIDGAASMITSKTATPPSGSYVQVGDTIYYTIDWENPNDYSVGNFAVRDAIPEHTTLVSGSIVVTGADGKSTTQLEDEYAQWREENSWWLDVEQSQPEPVIWYPGETVGPADAEGVYNAVVVDRTHQSFPEWDSVRQWLDTAKPGDVKEFVVTNDGFYDSKWAAVIASDGYVRLFHSILVPNKADSPEYREANGVFGNYDARDDAVYAKVGVVPPHAKGSLTFAVTVDEDAPADYRIENAYTFAGNVTGLPTGDLTHAGANTTTHIVGTPDVRVPDVEAEGDAKTVSPTGPVRPGDELTYTVRLVNKGTASAQGVAIYDELWQNNVKGVLYVPGSYQVSGGDAATQMADYASALTADTRSVAAYASELAPGEEMTMMFKVIVEDAVEGDVVTNKATWATDTTGIPTSALTNETNEVSNEIVRDMRPADVSVTMAQDRDEGASVAPGDEVSYTVTVTNNGSTPAIGVGVHAPIPVGTEYVASSMQANGITASDDGAIAGIIDRLEPGQSATITYKVKVSDGYYGMISSDATWADGQTAAPVAPLSKKSNDVDIVSPAPAQSVEVVKTQDRADGERVTPGDEITYTVTINNNGPVVANNIGIFDEVPTGAVYVEDSLVSQGLTATYENGKVAALAESVEAGAQASFTFKVRVAPGFAGGVVNQASWDYDVASAPTQELSRLTNDVDVISVQPTLSIVKTQTPPNGANVAGGDTLTYSITVTNVGPVKAHYVGIYDWAPEGTTYVAGSLRTDKGDVYEANDGLLTNIVGDLAKGEKATMTFEAKVNYDFVGTIHNRALWVSPAADPTTLTVGDVNNAQVHMVDMTSDEVSAQTNPRASSPAGVIFAQPALAVSVPIPDGAATGWSNDTADSGQGQSDSTTPGTSTEPSSGTDTGDTGQVSGDGSSSLDDVDDKGGSNEVVAHVTKPLILLTKTADVADGSYVSAGQEVTFTLVASNIGTNNANNLVVSDVIPSGMTYVDGSVSANATYESGKIWGTSTLASGETMTISFKAKVNDGFTGVIENLAAYEQNETATPTDNPSGGQSNKVTLRAEEPSIELLKSASVADGSYVAPGTEITYTVKATNKGDASISADVFDSVPNGMTLVADSIRGAETQKDAIMTSKTLAPGESVEFSFKVTVDNTDTPVDIVNTAAWKVTGSDSAGKPSNEVLVHVGLPGVSIVKTSDPADGSTVMPGDEVTYSIVLSNTGSVLGNVTMTDILPQNMTLVEGSLTGGLSVGSDGDLKWTGEVASGESVTLTYKATVNSGATGELRNVATAKVEGIATPASATDTLYVAPADFKVSKTSNPASGSSVASGQTIEYTVVVSNEGAAAGKAMLSDKLPSNLSFVEGSITGGATYADGTVSADIELAAGESKTIKYSAVATGNSGDEISNVAVVTPEKGNVVDSKSTLKVGVADWAIVKSVVSPEAVDGKHMVKAGDEVAYEVVIRNTGTAAGTAAMVDKLPEGLTYVDGSVSENATVADGAISADVNLAAGESTTVSYKATVADGIEGDIVNTATLTADVLNGPITGKATVVVPSGVVVDKHAVAAKSASGTQYSSVAYRNVGDTVTFAIDVTNNTDKAITAHVVDTPDAGLTFSKLASDVKTLQVYKKLESTESGDVYVAPGVDASKSLDAQVSRDTSGVASAAFDVDVEPGKTATVYVNCDVTKDAGMVDAKSTVGNLVDVTFGDDTHVTDYETVAKTTDKGAVENKGSLPQTGQTIAIVVLIASAAALAIGTIYMVRRRRKDTTRLYR